MIGVEGQYVLRLDVEGQKDLVKQEDFVMLVLEERAGLFLPSLKLVCNLADQDDLYYFKEGANIRLLVGKERLDYNLDFVSTGYVAKPADERISVDCGAIAFPDFLSKTSTDSFRGSSADTISVVAEKFFSNVDRSCEDTNDSMLWLQAGRSAKKFLLEVWKHSWYDGNNVLFLGISLGDFILRDLKGVSNAKHWIFSEMKDCDSTFQLLEVIYKSGVGDLLLDLDFLEYDLDKGKLQDVGEELVPLLSLDEQMPTLVEEKFRSILYKNENVHTNYVRALGKFLGFHSSLNGVKVKIVFRDLFLPIRVLDTVMLQTVKIDDKQSLPISGKYVVSRVIRAVTSTFMTTLILSKESI